MPLLERDDLVETLRAEAARAAAGHGRVVLVSGEAGAGKTSLVRTALDSAVWGFCEPLTTPRPLGPFRDIGETLWPEPPTRWNAVRIANRLIQHAQDPGPALVVEDAQWTDSASAEVVRFLARRIATTSGLLVVVSRDDAEFRAVLEPMIGELLLSGTIRRLDVPALSASAVAELVAETEIDVAEAMRLTGGNALLVSQLVGSDPAEPASSLRHAIAARLAQLEPEPRRLVEALSVVPGRIPDTALRDEEWPYLDQLAAAGMIRTVDDGVEFRHELVRLAIESGVPPGRRRALHADALQRFTGSGNTDPARLAHHARLARRPTVALAAEIEAARRAAVFGSHREAAAHYRRAVNYAREHAPPAEQIQLLRALAIQENAVGRDAAARDAAQQALQLSIALGDPTLHSTAARIASRLEPREERSLQLARAAVDMSERHGASAELAAAYANLANNRMVARDLDQAIVHAQRALVLAQEFGDTDSEIMAAGALGCSQLFLGDPAGETMLRRAIHLAAAHGNDPEVARGYANLVSSAGEAREYRLSAKATREALSYFTSRDLDGGATYVQVWNARCAFEQGQWEEAQAVLTSLSRPGAQLNAITRLIACYVSARLSARRGAGDPAPDLREADEIASTMGALQRVAPVVAAQAEVAWLTDRPIDQDRLLETYRFAIDLADRWKVGELGFWLWRYDRIGELPDIAAEPFRLHAHGELHAAARAWLTLGCPYEAAEALADSEAEDDLREALDSFGRLGAIPQWQRTARRLRQLGVRSIPRLPNAGKSRAPDGLTGRESEVFEWLAKGRTDAQIAAQLHLSVRTVEHHVTAILRKKGLRSRRDLFTP